MSAFTHTAPTIIFGVLLIATTAILTIIFTNLICRLFSNYSLPTSLPWAGAKSHRSALARARANLRSFFNLKSLLDEGYEQYSKCNRPFVLPYFLNGPQVMLPFSQIRWVLEQPDSVLSQEHVNRQFLEADYTFLHANLVDDPVHPEIIRHELTKKLGLFAGDLVEEVELCLKESWGTDTEEWHEIQLYDTMLNVITRLSTRAFIGLPLCRNDVFLKSCRFFNRNVALSAAALSILPSFFKPIFAPFIVFRDYLQYLTCSKFIVPLIRARLSQLSLEKELPLSDSKSPNDYIQWAINHALAKPIFNPREVDPRVIACRFSVLCFAAIQSSVITLTNTLFDLASSPDCTSSLNIMRNEVLQETLTNSTWSKAVLARMSCIDSALRESLRLNGFIERGIMKMVVAPGGVTLPDGSHIPYGTKVGISGYCVHHDDEYYPNAMTYDAFRFAKGSRDEQEPRELVRTSEKFLGFSHGRHACPGRFFAANQLKIALAHIALHYEIEPITKRPVNRWFFGHIAPPLTATLRVRRRRSEFHDSC